MRTFNRFYTGRVGLLGRGYLGSEYSLTQVRVLYEIAHADGITAAAVARLLDLDPAYLSRILRAFGRDGLLTTEASPSDARATILRLTEQGSVVFAALEGRSRDEIRALVAPLSAAERSRLVAATADVRGVLDPDGASRAWLLREPVAGDLGWVVAAHGATYAAEYGWDATFEGLVAEIVGAFAKSHDPARERVWIAERDGASVGCIFCVRKSDTVAQLRLLLVDPRARGLGIGRRLVEECVRFARAAGYTEMRLWTNDVLVAARCIYEAVGFRLVEEERHYSFGHDLVGQTFALAL